MNNLNQTKGPIAENAKEFMPGAQIEMPMRQRVQKARQTVNEIQFVDAVALVTLGLTVYTMSPVFLVATVVLLGIREAKDVIVKKDTESRVKKMADDVNLNLLAMDERLVAQETKITKLNQNQLSLDKQATESKNEINRFIIQQKQTLGLD